jgi:hypothetical protein
MTRASSQVILAIAVGASKKKSHFVAQSGMRASTDDKDHFKESAPRARCMARNLQRFSIVGAPHG